MAETDASQLPLRWRDLDKRTIEMVARLNEDEREALIEFSHMTPIQRSRLREFLDLPENKWRTGFRMVSQRVVIVDAGKTVMKMTLVIAALIVAAGQIWNAISPWVLRAK